MDHPDCDNVTLLLGVVEEVCNGDNVTLLLGVVEEVCNGENVTLLLRVVGKYVMVIM